MNSSQSEIFENQLDFNPIKPFELYLLCEFLFIFISCLRDKKSCHDKKS